MKLVYLIALIMALSVVFSLPFEGIRPEYLICAKWFMEGTAYTEHYCAQAPGYYFLIGGLMKTFSPYQTMFLIKLIYIATQFMLAGMLYVMLKRFGISSLSKLQFFSLLILWFTIFQYAMHFEISYLLSALIATIIFYLVEFSRERRMKYLILGILFFLGAYIKILFIVATAPIFLYMIFVKKIKLKYILASLTVFFSLLLINTLAVDLIHASGTIEFVFLHNLNYRPSSVDLAGFFENGIYIHFVILFLMPLMGFLKKKDALNFVCVVSFIFLTYSIVKDGSLAYYLYIGVPALVFSAKEFGRFKHLLFSVAILSIFVIVIPGTVFEDISKDIINYFNEVLVVVGKQSNTVISDVPHIELYLSENYDNLETLRGWSDLIRFYFDDTLDDFGKYSGLDERFKNGNYSLIIIFNAPQKFEYILSKQVTIDIYRKLVESGVKNISLPNDMTLLENETSEPYFFTHLPSHLSYTCEGRCSKNYRFLISGKDENFEKTISAVKNSYDSRKVGDYICNNLNTFGMFGDYIPMVEDAKKAGCKGGGIGDVIKSSVVKYFFISKVVKRNSIVFNGAAILLVVSLFIYHIRKERKTA